MTPQKPYATCIQTGDSDTSHLIFNLSGYKQKKGGFSLVEVAIALGISAFCLLTLLALLPTGLHYQDSSSRQSDAVSIGNGIFADLKTTASYAATNSLTTLPATTRYGITIPTSSGTTFQYALYLDENGNPETTSANATFLAILTLICPTTTGVSIGLPKPAVLAHLLITWPAAANPSLSTAQNTLTSTSNDLRAQLKNYSGMVELAGSVDLEQ